MPEREGEAMDPNFIRFTDGLDLTNIQIIPHKDYIQTLKVDGLSLVDDIIIPDSFGCKFYFISDESYFKAKDGRTIFKGKGEIIEDGLVTPLKQGAIVPFMGYVEQPVIKTLFSEGYDMVFCVEKNDKRCEVYYLNDDLRNLFVQTHLEYNEICEKLALTVVPEERASDKASGHKKRNE